MPTVSIILPTRSRPALLPRAIASVLAQTEPGLELLVVDNSPPGAPPLDLPADPRLRRVPAPLAVNAAAARNAGLAAATGDWVGYLDDDDAYRPGKIAAQLALAARTGSPLVLCGACFHLRGRRRHVQTTMDFFRGDDLLNRARWGTPFLLHRRCGEIRFDETLFAGEDAHFAQALLAAFSLQSVPVVPEPLVDVYQDAADLTRTNLRASAGWRAARRLWWEFGGRYSSSARRLFVLRALVARAKLRGEPRRCAALLGPLLRVGGSGQLRFALNALVVSAGLGRGRWVT